MKRIVLAGGIAVLLLGIATSCRQQQEIETVSPREGVEYVRIITVYKDGTQEISPIYVR